MISNDQIDEEVGTRARRHPFLRTRAGILTAVAAVVTALLASLVVWRSASTSSAPPPQPSVPSSSTAVVGLGYLEPESTVVTIGAPGGGEAARIAELKVVEGQDVQTGDVLAVLDSAAKLSAQVEAAQAQVILKKVLLQRQRLEIESTLNARRAALARARAELDTTQAEYRRQVDLAAQEYATVAVVESKRREFLAAQANVDEAQAALRRTESLATDARRRGKPTLIDVAVTEQELASAQAELKVAQASLEQGLVRAPFSGRVIELKTRPGARVGSEGVLDLGTTQRMRAVVEVYQSDIDRVHAGQVVELRADVFNRPLSGRVERIGIAVKRQTVVNNDPATSTDARVIDVHVSLSPDASRLVSSLSRLQVRAVFRP